MRSALALVGMAQLAGCQLIFELEDTQNIEGSFVYRRASLGADNTISVSNIPATDAAIQFIFEDEAVDVPIREDGTFSVAKRGASYRFLSGFNLNTGEIVETSNTLTIALDQAGRADIEPITQSTVIDLPLSPADVTRSFVTIGQWTHLPANMGFVDWNFVPALGLMPIGLLDATANDRVFIVDSAVNAYAPDQLAIVAVGSDKVVMQDGVRIDLRGVGVELVGQTDCATFGMALASDIGRLQEAVPDAVLEPATLALTAVPALETGTAGGFQIARTEGMALDADLDMPAHHPFPDHPTVAQIQILARSPLRAPGAPLVGSVLSGYTMVVEVPRGKCPTNRVPVDSQGIAFATAIAIDGQLLETPAQQFQISRPGKAVVTWEANGAADFFDVVLFEVLERNGKLELDQKRLYRTREPRIEIPDMLLTPNRHFVLQVSTSTGFPGAANGDYATFGYPNVKASVVSLLFTAI